MNYLRAILTTLVGEDVSVGRSTVRIPNPLAIRLSTVLGNRRIHRLMDPFLTPGSTVIDVGANIGFNTVYVAQRVGPSGRVVAIEPADDNLAVLRSNVSRNGLANVTVVPAAAGRARERRDFFVRGAVSAVNSLYPDSVYAEVTSVVTTPVERVDDLAVDADLVKIDVEGAELEVLEGMTRLLHSPSLRLVVEWHPLLQEKAGYAAGALPHTLLDLGFSLVGASHTRRAAFTSGDVTALSDQLRRSGRPIDILAERTVPVGRRRVDPDQSPTPSSTS